jgi:diadenosine tetraphosphate (Ap4A) HIT family hydrolase
MRAKRKSEKGTRARVPFSPFFTDPVLADSDSIMDQHGCPFCHLAQSRVHLESEFAAAFLDAFPVSEGHTLVVPKRHVASLFDLPEAEQAALWRLVALVRGKLLAELQPDGFNLGVNDGAAAGQTVMHAHVHIIPRRTGDVADPRGGVRWVLPAKAPYWVEEPR